MTVEADFRAALLAHAPVASLVGTRVAQNAIEQGLPAPYVVFAAAHAPEHGLNGTLLGDLVTIDCQCWAATAVQASALADAVTAALALQSVQPTGRATAYDPELALDAVVLTVLWITA